MCVIGVALIDRFLDPFDKQPFIGAAWAVADEQSRGRMARDAIRHLPPGTPKDRVQELLGEGGLPSRNPHEPWDSFGVRLDHSETWVYRLGTWSSIGPYGFDDAFLYVHFGTDDRVVSAEINGG